LPRALNPCGDVICFSSMPTLGGKHADVSSESEKWGGRACLVH
jgi:hypothetical protein